MTEGCIMTGAPVIKISAPAIRRRAPRLAGDMRRAQIIEAACEFFADHGFSGPTRDLAASIGVTQALLYRYFDSKTDLIEAVFAAVFSGSWGGDAVERFEATDGDPMVERLSAVYEGMLPRMTRTATRLLFRAGLDSYAGPISRNACVGHAFAAAVVAAWRSEEGHPSLEAKSMLEGERMLALSMHDAMLSIRMREHVLHAPRTLEDADAIRQTAEIYDAGARAVMNRLHVETTGLGRAAPSTLAEGALVAA